LVSYDANSNNYHYKYTIQSELCPVCTDDLVAIPKGHTDLLSGGAPLMICHKMSTTVHLLDPLTLRGCDIPAYEYWKKPFEPAATRSQCTEFVVLNVEEVELPEAGTKARHHLAGRGKMKLADVEVARAQDFGVNDERLIVRSHMGAILRPGNRVLGYDLRYINLSGYDQEQLEATQADVFLVKKVFQRKRGRAWEVRRLEREREEGEKEVDDNLDMEMMKQDLEEDPELRRNVNMYRQEGKPNRAAGATVASNTPAEAPAAAGAAKAAEDEDNEDDENAPEVPLAELLEGLQLRDED
jgi:nonsense-mediated mRNA decay protein 3